MRKVSSACGLMLAGAMLLAGEAIAQHRVKTPGVAAAFRNVERIETDLRRGVSTRADVRRLLGEPTGTGGALLPTATKSHEAWTYENVEVEVVGTQGGSATTLRARQRWDAIIVFFDGETFDGFFWWRSAGESTGTAR